MDPLSFRSGLLSVLGSVSHVEIVLHDAGKVSKDTLLGQLRMQVLSLQRVLQQFQELSDNRDDPSRKENWLISKTFLQEHSTLEQIARDLVQIEDFARVQSRSKYRLLWNRLGSNDAKRKEIHELRRRLRDVETQLHTVLNLSFYSLTYTPNTLETGSAGSSRLRSRFESEALHWLSALDLESRHTELRDRRVISTGSWLLEHELYGRWQESSEPGNVLWIPGTPGAGKTFLASYVIDDLRRKHRHNNNIAVAHFYCDYRQQDTYTTANILANVLKQLISKLYPLPQSVTDLFHSYQNGADSLITPRLGDVRKEFLSVSKRFDRVFIVIDALDECDVTYRGELLRWITGLEPSFRLLITSRQEVDTSIILQNYAQIQLSNYALRSNIEIFISTFVQRSNLSSVLDTRDRETRETTLTRLVNTIYHASGGSFLLARLRMEGISKLGSLPEILNVLSTPQTIQDVYAERFAKLSNRSSVAEKQAATIVSWIFRAKRPLLVRELQQALATSIADTSLGSRVYPTASIMVERCLGLIDIEDERSVVRFIHFSVQEFLQEGYFAMDTDCIIANTCLTFLNFDNFAIGQCEDDQALQRRLQDYPFLEYAAQFWAVHGQSCTGSSFEQLAIKLLSSDRHVACASQLATYDGNSFDRHSRLFFRKLSGLHVAASYGLIRLVKLLLQDSRIEVDIKDDYGQTPILYAAKQGHISVVEFLAGEGAEIDVRDSVHHRSALSWATLNGHTSLVEWLLCQKFPIDINTFDYQHSTPLHLAFERHHHDIVDLLVAQGASLNLVDQWQRTQAQLAFSGSSPVDFADYVKDRTLSNSIAQGGQARVTVFRKHGGSISSYDPYPFLFRKAFYTTGVEGAETLRLLVQERDYLRNLHHPNIVTFVGYEENEDHSKAYLWTEYCNGSDLSKFIRKDLGNDRIVDPNRKLTKREIWRIFSDIAAAVSYLHYGVIKENNLFSLKTDWRPFLHRDIKPANVVVQNMPANVPTYKLCDLGIAKIWDPTINQTRKGRGTGPWMPKEVKEQLLPWTVKGDISSIGATMRDLVKDFEDPTFTAIVNQCMDDTPAKRPNSLSLLQIAREELATAERDNNPRFLPERPSGMDYIHQAILELLERVFHHFTILDRDLRKHLTEKILLLLEDAKLRSADCWGLDRSLALALVLGREERARELIMARQAAWDCPWNTYGLTPVQIATHDKLSIRGFLEDQAGSIDMGSLKAS